jgi:hypothetical protein
MTIDEGKVHLNKRKEDATSSLPRNLLKVMKKIKGKIGEKSGNT